jgi:hypothetical protein
MMAFLEKSFPPGNGQVVDLALRDTSWSTNPQLIKPQYNGPTRQGSRASRCLNVIVLAGLVGIVIVPLPFEDCSMRLFS